MIRSSIPSCCPKASSLTDPTHCCCSKPDVANHAESVTSADLDGKLRALEAHRSQMETTHFYRVGDGDALEEFRRGERDRVEASGRWAGVGLAEAFHLIRDQL